MKTHELISADSHVNPPPQMWAERLPREFRERAPRIEKSDEGDVQVFEGRRTPILGINAMAGKREQDFSWNIRRLSDQRAGGYDPAARLADMDLDHVQAEILYGGGPLPSQDPALRLASFSAYNDWLADFCSHEPRRLIGQVYLPCETPEIAIAELRRCARRAGLRGCVITRFPQKGDWFDPEWDPFWLTLVELGWPAGIHVGGRSREPGMPRLDSTGFIVDLLMSKLALAEACAMLAVSGLLQRHPELQVVSVEGQIGWLSFAEYYLDHVWAKHRHWVKNELPEPPSFYLRRQVSATFMEDPVGLRERHAIGVERILWSSDYPHSETTWPDSKKLTDDWFTEIAPDERRKILYENTARLYGI